MSGKRSSHTSQLTIKHLHHVAPWSAKGGERKKKDMERKGRGMLTKRNKDRHGQTQDNRQKEGRQ